MKKIGIFFMLVIASSLANDLFAEDVNMTDTIKGNQQHPNVLFIVPWQSPPATIPMARKMAIRLPDYLTQPIERAEFMEQFVSTSKSQ